MKTKTCQNCSTINKYNNTYCTNCGFKFKENFVVPLIILNIVNFIADIMAFILFLNFEMDGYCIFSFINNINSVLFCYDNVFFSRRDKYGKLF